MSIKILILRYSLFFLILFKFSIGFGQTYTSTRNGNWNSASTWVITDTGGCGSTIPSTPPVSTNNRSCPINVIINHDVSRTGTLTVGNNNIVSINITANRTLSLGSLSITGNNSKSVSLSGEGLLEMSGNLTISGNTQMTISESLVFSGRDFNLSQQGNLVLSQNSSTTSTRDFSLSNQFQLSMSNNAKLTVERDLTLSDQSSFEVNNQANVIVESDVELADQSQFIGRDSTSFTVLKNLTLSDQSTASFSGNSLITVEEDLLVETNNQNNGLRFSGESRGLFEGNNTFDSNSATLFTTGNAEIIFNGYTEFIGGSDIFIQGNSQVTINANLDIEENGTTLNLQNTSRLTVSGNTRIRTGADVTIANNGFLDLGGTLLIEDNGSSLNLEDDSELLVDGATTVQDGADVTIEDNSAVNIKNSLSLDNTSGTNWINRNNSTSFIEGNFNKGGNSYLYVRNSGIFEVCTGSFPELISDPRIVTDPSPAYYGGCRILPVNLYKFEAKLDPSKNASILSWSTAKEWNNSHFEIERSVNGIQNWIKIGEVQGHGYSDQNQEYNFMDQYLPSEGGILYYRIKQVDFDSNFSFSSVKSVQFTSKDSTKIWKIYPNPSSQGDRIKLDFSELGQNIEGETFSVNLSDATGTFSYQFRSNEKNDLEEWLNQSLENQKKGLYILTFIYQNTAYQVKISRK